MHSIGPTPNTESAILVIGVGNAYRSDDAVGPILIERLKVLQESQSPPQALVGVALLEQSGEGAALMEAWRGANAVILVDAVSSGAEPGTIHRLDVAEQKIPTDFFSYSTHAFSVAEAVEMARVMHQLPPRMILYGIEGKTFDYGLDLSPEVEQAAQIVVGRVLQALQTWTMHQD